MSYRYTDFTFLKENTFGNIDSMRDLLNIYLQTTPIMLEQLCTHIEMSEWQATAKLAHKLKSNVNTVGAVKAVSVLDEIEVKAKEGKVQNIKKEAIELAELIYNIKAEVQEELEELGLN